jgi:hypothetical protein
MTKYIDLTPTWQEILPTWHKMYDQVTRPISPRPGIKANYQVVRDNFWREVERMARAADQLSYLLESLATTYDMSDGEIQQALADGKAKLIARRSQIQERIDR